MGIKSLDFFHEFRFQAHGTEAVDLAVDIVVAVDQADILDLGAHLDDTAAALQFQVLDDADRVAVLQDIAGRIAVHAGALFRRFASRGRPLMRSFRADQLAAVFVREFGLALRAWG